MRLMEATEGLGTREVSRLVLLMLPQQPQQSSGARMPTSMGTRTGNLKLRANFRPCHSHDEQVILDP
jgi:hypothetical protein